jgi:uncharacterized surface protein with fasciclin (FAS1) repeats
VSRHLRFAPALALSALVLSACAAGGGRTTGAGQGVASLPASVPAAASSSIDATAPNDVISILLRDEQLSRLATLLKGSGLTDVLSDGKPHTVFAPDDAAFRRLEPGLTRLVESGQIDWLAARLRYHVVLGVISPEQLRRTKVLKSITGQDIRVSLDGTRTVLGGSARVLASHEASEGWVYRIDTVLEPPPSR